MRAAEVKIPERLAFSSGSVSIFRDAVNHSVRVLAQTAPLQVPQQWLRQDLTREPCSWTFSWWAKAVRWCLRKRFLSRLIPYPLQALVYANEIVIQPKIESWPDKVYDSILAQMFEIEASNRQPRIIAIGQRAYWGLMDLIGNGTAFTDFSQYIPLNEFSTEEKTFRGLPLILTTKLEPEAVLVL